VLLAALSAAALLGLGGARASAQSSEAPALVVQAVSLGSESLTAILFDAEEPVASTEVHVPAGYGLASPKAGAEIGYVSIALTDVKRSDTAFASGDLVVDDQTVAPSPSDDCAPGRHSARWHADLGLVGHAPLRLFVYVDVQPPGADSAAVLRFCPVWQGSGAPTVVAQYVSLILEDQITDPASPGVDAWRAVVQPATWVGDILAPKAGSTFETRSLVAHPHTLTLSARYEKNKTVVLSGRLLAAGRPEAGVEVNLAAWADGTDDFSSFAPVVTNSVGEFTARRRVTVSTTFTASVDPLVRACQAPSAAPGGCRSESVSPPTQASAYIHVRGKREARLVPRARDQALARRATLRAEDFPAGWQGVGSPDPFFPCPGFQPDLSKLTVGGEASSLVFFELDKSAAAWSSTEVYTSVEQARTAFLRTATVAAARCVAKESRGDETTIVSVGAHAFARVGDATRMFRIVLSDSEGTGNADLVYVRRGRTLMRMAFAGLDDLSPLETTLAKALIARAH
jgi:hypothetical protein